MNITSTLIFEDKNGYRHAIDSRDITKVSEIGVKKEGVPTEHSVVTYTDGSIEVALPLDHTLTIIARAQGIEATKKSDPKPESRIVKPSPNIVTN